MEKATGFIESLNLPKRLERKEVLLPIVVSIAAATALLYVSYRRSITKKSDSNKKKKFKQGFKEIPLPGSCYPYVGHMLSLGELPGREVAKWHKELGPIFKLRMGIQTWVMVDDPTLAHKIFVSHGVESSYRPRSNYSFYHYGLGGKGIGMAQPDDGWKEARAAVLSVLGPKQIEKYMDSILRESTVLVDGLIESSEKNGGVDPLKYLELNSLNIIFMACFGRRFKSVKDPEFLLISSIVEKGMKYAGLENDLPNFLPALTIFNYFAGTEAKMNRFIRTERDPVFRKLISEAAASEGPNVIKSLEEDGYLLDEDAKVVLMSDLIGGGMDTTSVTLAWNIAMMCHYPEIQKKAAAEIDEFIKSNGRLPLFAERLQLPYCISVIKECMRCHPTTPFGLPHTVEKDLEIDGYLIPKGATLISSMESMHMRADLYPEPERFYPERFMNNTKTMLAAANGKLEDRDHFNFGWGRRICPAIYLAEVELFSAFVRILARCLIEPATAAEDVPDIVGAKNAGLTLLPLPYKVRFTKRADALL